MVSNIKNKEYEKLQLKKQKDFREQSLVGRLEAQLFSEIIKSKSKWTDDLFPPDDSSLYSGKTAFSLGYKNNTVPDIVKVTYNCLIIILILEAIQG